MPLSSLEVQVFETCSLHQPAYSSPAVPRPPQVLATRRLRMPKTRLFSYSIGQADAEVRSAPSSQHCFSFLCFWPFNSFLESWAYERRNLRILIQTWQPIHVSVREVLISVPSHWLPPTPSSPSCPPNLDVSLLPQICSWRNRQPRSLSDGMGTSFAIALILKLCPNAIWLCRRSC